MFEDRHWQGIQADLALSPRELEIVQRIFDDSTESMIAQDLGISKHTVHTHLRRIYGKLEVRSRCQLLRRVVETHLSRPSDR